MGSIAISKASDSFLASAPSQFIQAHCLAWPAGGGQSGPSHLLLDHVEFSDDHDSSESCTALAAHHLVSVLTSGCTCRMA